MSEIVIFTVALIAAIRGADWIGKASITFAKRLGVSPFVIGATFVSLATTLPELTVGFISGTFNHDPLFGLGNVLGSPIINIGLILGSFFIIAKHQPSLGYYSRAINIFIIVSFILLIASFFVPIGGLLSLFLILSGLAFIVLEYLLSQREGGLIDSIESRFEKFISFFHLVGNRDVILEFIFGTALLIFGCKFLVDSGITIANNIGVDDFFISATLLAIGTSLPELITMITSLVKKRDGVSIGNLVGASVIDITLGTGLATIVKPATLSTPFNLLFFGIMIALGIICLIALWKKVRIEIIGGTLVVIAICFIFSLALLEFTSF